MHREWSLFAVAFALGALTGALAVAALTPDSAGPPALLVTPQGHAPHRTAAVQVAGAAAPNPNPAPAGPSDPAPAPEGLQARLDAVSAGWARMEDEVTRLRLRVADLEQRLAAVQSKPVKTDAGAPRRLGATADGQRSALVKAGLADEEAAELVRRQGQQSLDRLNLRDVAAREGWLGTDRYREELARLEEGAVVLREELGDEVYDRYLFAAGDDNRVQVDGIIPGSVAELAGLQPGDLIESYAGERVFTFSGLRDLTAGGERGELVQVQVMRGGQVFDTWLARGPLGVELDSASAEPR